MNKSLGKVFSIITVIALVFTMIAPVSYASFWRILFDQPDPYIPGPELPLDPPFFVFYYGYGYGDVGAGWGYGYGYGPREWNAYGYYVGEQAYEDPRPVTGATLPNHSTLQGPDIPTKTTKVTMTNTVAFQAGGIQVVLPQGLEITRAGGDYFNPLNLAAAAGGGQGLASIIGTNVLINGSAFFGLTGIKLLFSMPVMVVIPVPGLPNGAQVNIAVQHAGENFTSASLSVDPNATCNNGIATPSSGIATVTGGTITVYTCAASQFAAFSGGPPAGTVAIGGGGGGDGVRGAVAHYTRQLEEGTPIEEVAEGIVTAFQDIAGHWAESYIKIIADLGIVQGKTSTRFAPNDNITRAELTKIALKAFGYSVPPTVSSVPFPDVSTGAWYAPYVLTARNNGIVQGINGYFRPNQSITRVDALKILLEAAEFDIPTSATGFLFPDVPAGEWFAKYVKFAKDAGIVSGYQNGMFGPGNYITRAEVAKIVVEIMEMM